MTMNIINQPRLVLAPLLVLLAHCASGGGAKATAPAPAVGDDGGAVGGDDAGNTDTDAGATPTGSTQGDGGGACVAEAGAGDPPDDMGVDTNCDGADGIVGKDVYVDPTNGEDSNDGKPMTPMLSLTAALKLATSRGGSVLVAAGTPTDATLAAPGTWAIYGGYGPAFIGPVTRSLTTLTPPSTGLFVDQAASAHLAHMTVQALMPPATGTMATGLDGGAGVLSLSAHALRSNVAHLELDDMVLQAPQGADGTAGTAGAAGKQGNGSNLCSLPASAYGASAGVSPDGITQPGNVASKKAAAPATAGYDGTDGNDAAATLSLAAGVLVPLLGTVGRSDATPGYGGASGGNGTWNSAAFLGGMGGSGGCPGTGGVAGTSAGSSVALLVLSGTTVVTRSSLLAGLGGTGGDGGAGGAGGAGQMGLPPGASWEQPRPSVPATCDPQMGDVMQMGCAAYGGPGGNGGAGGHGGAGAGGWSVGVLTASGATVSLDAATTVTITKAGVGGMGSQGSRGASGEAHAKYGMP
jgi:hypothetical protein